ncbi:hypothetical protein HD806DRAFT_496329 [Xylariaceae sp. AK1471]|nr:hypothetical protein HD806DRAFT_496329 [Xylariaceae sp. AK1471]
MESVASPPVKPEPSTEPEAFGNSNNNDNGNGIVKPEPSDASSILSRLQSVDVGAVRASPSSQPDCKGAVPPGSETITSTTPASQLDSKETDYLERLCTKNALEVLETSVSVATQLLDQLQDALSTHRNPDVDAWIKTITDLRMRTVPTRTVVGVVGNTGAGKSSIINALLDEERLLPTNCLRACTASPTEISFNYSDDPQELYRAEIEFISSEDWIRELQVLFSDLLDGSGQVSREATNTDSDAGIAYAKVKAVYPQKTREMIAQANPRDLANEPAVRGILGSTKILKEAAAKELYRRMQHYVDSKEKSTGPADHRKRVDVPMEYWPLIKVVRIFTKANALSTGAVIVDLPGVQDSNAARAAVAANYMKSCTGLWIVAPINRAVDDKTAKSLLGGSFKRQLKYDGTYSAVSFICSKTDDISITEAAESLGLEAEITESWDTAEDMRRTKRSLKSKIADLKEAKAALIEQLDECEAKTDVWEDLQSQLSGGKTVYAPSANSKKRKRGGRPSGSRKNLDSSDADDDWDASDSSSSDKENSQPQEDRQPLTEENIEEQISLLRAQRKKIREERRSLDSQIAGLRKDIEKIEIERDNILADLKAICIKGRNDYSRGAIKQDFAMGIKELDQENAAEEDDANFDPDQDIRDYEEVARSLPVFCVSSRAYQKLSGKLEKDDFESHGFLSVEDTEVPKLQEHAKKLTEAGRASHCRRFLNDLCQLVNSMKLWAANDGTSSYLTDGEKRREEMHLKKLLDHLEEELESSLKSSVALIQKSLEEHIYENINTSIPSAVQAAPDTAYSWGAHRSEGGLFWATYKATVRRNGVYSGASGPRDFNQDLFDPISRNLATGWERAFQRRLPAILEGFAKEAMIKLQHFHQAAKARAEQRHTNVAGLVTLSNQILAHMRTVQALPATIRAKITDLQREANRQFTPVICEAMTTAYEICTNERGQGSYARMKAAMANHVDNVRYSMFQDATKVVKGQLEAMCRAVKQDIADSIQGIFDTIFIDYMRTLVGTEVDRSAKLPREELDMRRSVYKVLLLGDKMFAPVLGETAFEASDDAAGDDPAPLATPAAKSMEATADEAIPDEAETHGADGDNVDVDKDKSMNDLDELLQAQIREQGSNEEAEEDDPFASEDEFPDVMDIFKKDQE